MSFTLRNWYAPSLALAVLLLPLSVTAGGKNKTDGSTASDAQTVELFAAMEKGQIEVKVIPKDASQIRVLITNKTQEPLSVKLPDAIAAVPVLAQAAGGGGGGRKGGGGGSTSSSSSGQQALGGGGGGGMMGGGGGGAFDVAPEKVGQFKASTVCLEYGKPEPRPASSYTLKPIQDVTPKPEVQELCRLVGNGTVNHRIAQLAAWHLNNDMTWEQLAKAEYRFANGGGVPQFSLQEIRAAMELASAITKVVEQKKLQNGSTSGSGASGSSSSRYQPSAQ